MRSFSQPDPCHARKSRNPLSSSRLPFSAICLRIFAAFLPPFSQLSDTVFKLNRSDSSEPGAVNKFAAVEAKTVNKSSDIDNNLRPAKAIVGRVPHRSPRSLRSYPARVYRRKPAEPRGPVQKSERTSPHEGFCISVTGDRTFGGRQKPPMKNWNEITHYLGFDWAKDHHQVVIVDRQARIVAEFQFEHSLEGWNTWRERMRDYPALAVAIETNQGAAVEQLLQSSVTIYPINPRSAKAYRQRKVPTTNKTDRLDAWSLAEALRTDGQSWRPLQPLDPLIQELRLLCRDELNLIAQRTSLINQLQQALMEYYPSALEAFDDWTVPATWKFLERFPTPDALTAAGLQKWNAFLHCHKLYRQNTHARRIAAFSKASEWHIAPALQRAKSFLVVSLVKCLIVLEKQLQQYRKRIEELFASHPDHDLFGSLPGAGPKMAPRLLSELGDDRTLFPDADSLRCYAGTAPVSYQSGQVHKVYLRRQCNKPLRCAIHLWADLSRRWCQWAQTYYQQLRKRGKSHAQALRCLGHRWLKIIWKMWQTRTTYDEALHTRNQTEHGSWVLQLMDQKPSE